MIGQDLASRLEASPVDAARLCVAFAGVRPAASRSLVSAKGPIGALQELRSGRAGNARIQAAASVDWRQRIEELDHLGIDVAFKEDPEFPTELAYRSDSPDLLFVVGSFPQQPAVAVVGTRRCTAYGSNLAEAYGVAIAEAGWVLVSGLARGIDAAAHAGTVSVGGVGVAVVGCGLDIDYPRQNRALRCQLERNGAVASEYSPGTIPEPWRFPPRNRIISGSTRAVVVVEAAATGGALITARHALEAGISVFAVPGDVGRPSSEGCNLLIRDGAHPVFSPPDLVAELELVLGPAASSPLLRADLDWKGLTVDQFSEARNLEVADAAATLARAAASGVLVEREGRFFPAPASGWSLTNVVDPTTMGK